MNHGEFKTWFHGFIEVFYPTNENQWLDWFGTSPTAMPFLEALMNCSSWGDRFGWRIHSLHSNFGWTKWYNTGWWTERPVYIYNPLGWSTYRNSWDIYYPPILPSPYCGYGNTWAPATNSKKQQWQNPKTFKGHHFKSTPFDVWGSDTYQM